MPHKIGVKGAADGGWSWLIVLAAFTVQFVVIGVHNLFGLLYIELLKESNADEAVVAWIGSISFSVQFIIGPFTTALCTKFGCRAVSLVGSVIFGLGLFSSSYVTSIYFMYATYSVVFAVGSSFLYFTSILILNEYFTRRLVLANGLALAGCGVGTLALAPLMNFFLDKFHWRVALRLSSGIAVVLVLCSLVYYLVLAPLQLQQAGQGKDSSSSSSSRKPVVDVSVFRNKAYVVWVAAVGLIEFGFYIPYVHLVRHCQDLGIPKSTGAMLVGAIAISQTVGKVVYGRVSDIPRVNRVHLFQACLLVCSVMTTLLPLFTSVTSLLAYCIIFGLHDGCFVVLLAVLTGDVAGRSNMTSALGLLYMCVGFPLMLGPAVAGWMYEYTSSYEPAFYMAGAFTTIAVCLLFTIPWLLPAEIKEEWRARISGYVTNVTSDLSDASPSQSPALANDLEDQQLTAEDSPQEKKNALKKFSESVEHILDIYSSMPKLNSQEDNVPSKAFASGEKWGLVELRKETIV